jgi:hypothetical protein
VILQLCRFTSLLLAAVMLAKLLLRKLLLGYRGSIRATSVDANISD